MNKKVVVSVLATFILASFHLAEAQQPAKIPRIGFVAGTLPDSVVELRRGLRDLGYIEGKNILIEYRYAKGVAEFGISEA